MLILKASRDSQNALPPSSPDPETETSEPEKIPTISQTTTPVDTPTIPDEPTPVEATDNIYQPISTTIPETDSTTSTSKSSKKKKKKRKKCSVNTATQKCTEPESDSEPPRPEKKTASTLAVEDSPPDPISTAAPDIAETPVENSEPMEILQPTRRKLKALIQGLSTDIEIPDLEKELTDLELRPIRIEQLRKRRGQELKLISLYLAILWKPQRNRETPRFPC
nr:cell surface glycoprotein 1-like [Parasteatoda tepidariorum]